MSDPAIRGTFVAALRGSLADATTLVWQMQNALTEPPPAPGKLTEELRAYCADLYYRAGIIAGYVERWSLWEKEQEKKDAVQP